LVFDDVDMDRAARALCWGSMVNAGQSCMSLERAYVQRAAMADFMSRLMHHASQLQPCWPDIRKGQTGPIIALAQVDVIRAHLQDAFDKGATALTGGQLVQRGGGWWCEPTVLVNVNHSMRIMREETFAPILPLMAFDTEAQGIALANDSDYGLSACVFSADLARAERVASQLKAGAVSINDASLTAIVHGGAKQSFGLSGLGGSRMGPRSIERFVRLQAHIQSNGADSPWWYT
jgi:succinate-semialdehyde dehydrogenase / glutarate-semialdehyde dehydrogenase